MEQQIGGNWALQGVSAIVDLKAHICMCQSSDCNIGVYYIHLNLYVCSKSGGVFVHADEW